MENYIKYISKLSKEKSNVEFLNSDTDRALAVLVQIINSSSRIVRIFAGALCSEVPSDNQYVSALSDFIERNGVVRIMLNQFDDSKAKESNLFKRLAYYLELNKDIKIFSTEARPYLISDPEKNEIHFTTGDDCAYRVETDIDKKTAKCNFNNPQAAENLIQFFDELAGNAEVTDEITEHVKKLFVD